MTKQQLSETMIDFMAARIDDIEYTHLKEVVKSIRLYMETKEWVFTDQGTDRK